MRKPSRITFLFGVLQLLLLVILLSSGIIRPAWAANEKEVVDRLHGFACMPREGWSAVALGNAILFHDIYHFVLIRAVRHDGNLQKAAKSWIEERKATETRFNASRYAYKKVGKGIVLVGEGLDYPYALLPMMAVNFGLLQKTPPSNYREVTSILPGEKFALVVTFLFPDGTPKSKLDEMTALLRSLRFLPPQQMVKWRTERIIDPEVGMEAATLHVPEGFQFQGTVIRQGTKRLPVMMLQKGDTMGRIDHIAVQSLALQTGFGGSGSSLITINEQSMQIQQPVFAQSEDDVVQLLLAIWQGETGQSWTLKEKKQVPLTQEEAQQFAQVQQMGAQTMAAMGAQTVSTPLKLVITAENGSLRRWAMIQGSFGASGRSDWVASSQMGHVSLIVHLWQAPISEFESSFALFVGIQNSWRGNPAQVLSALERWTIENKQLNDLVRQMTQEHREFNSKMAATWSNLLSDQTYVKDPQTSEISRVYKQSWETGGFWREPVFGDVLLGGVREGSKLEELLKTEGWRRMQESLEGFPNK
ncbi:MAG: hypothetical protein KatS3mg022_3217 [Armatimonadota bacterium]|nr:MAG: hypothetical protein KatS3mg022_3217 [Armatimonadota bacterium]